MAGIFFFNKNEVKYSTEVKKPSETKDTKDEMEIALVALEDNGELGEKQPT